MGKLRLRDKPLAQQHTAAMWGSRDLTPAWAVWLQGPSLPSCTQGPDSQRRARTVCRAELRHVHLYEAVVLNGWKFAPRYVAMSRDMSGCHRQGVEGWWCWHWWYFWWVEARMLLTADDAQDVLHSKEFPACPRQHRGGMAWYRGQATNTSLSALAPVKQQ